MQSITFAPRSAIAAPGAARAQGPSARRGVVSARASAPKASSSAKLSFSSSPASRSLSSTANVASIAGLVKTPARGPIAARASAVDVSCSLRVLVVNTNGGGHSPIGFHMCKKLAQAGHQVMIMTVGTEDDKKMNKPPFTMFNELRDLGVKTVWGNPSDVQSVAGEYTFNCVVDNNGKDLDSVGPVIDFAKRAGASQFLFVSSCGVYKKTDLPPHIEGDAVNPDAGHVKVEQALAASGMEWSSFRPQYLTGYGSNKDCEEWFFDRIVRGRKVPVPGSGWQMSNIANCEDLGNMMAMAVGNPAAANQVFNCVHNKGVTLDGMVRLCAKVAGVDCPEIVHYDPDQVGGKKAFPFRPVHFYAQPQAASTLLGWEPQHSLESTLQTRWAEYQRLGRGQKDMDFPLDDEILASMGGGSSW